jgi:hypothetical protein
MRKVLTFIGIFILVIVFVAGVIRLFSGEDDWMCKNGEWIEHGHPSTPKPTGICLK